MNNVQILLLASIGTVFVGLAIAMTLAIRDSLKNGQETREKLSRRLQQLPYRSMLVRRHIDMDEYLAKILVKDIRIQLNNCAGCQALEKCKTVLGSDNNAREQDYAFCPNDSFFRSSAARS